MNEDDPIPVDKKWQKLKHDIEPQTTDAVPGDPVFSGGAFYIPEVHGQVPTEDVPSESKITSTLDKKPSL